MMKALVFNNIKDLEYKEVPDVELKQGEVLIKIKACGICSSDLDRYNFSGAYHYPIILGHEMSGEIVACANDIDTNYIGKRAVIFPLLPCKQCENCKNGDYAQCVNYDYFGSRRDGGFREYIAVPLWNIKVFDNSIEFSTAALAEPASVAWHCVSKISNKSDKNILIIGSGTIGILIALWSKMKGLEPWFISRNESKTQFLKSFGLNNIISNNTDKKFDTVIECVGSNESYIQAIDFAKTKGQIILVGNPKSDMTLPRKSYWKILRQELNITGIWNSIYEKDWEAVLNNISKIPAQKLITHKFELKDGIKAFETMSDSKQFKIKGMFVIE